MTYHVVTLFPNLYRDFSNTSIIKRAVDKKILKIEIYNLRDFAKDGRKTVDGKPFGGGPGMLLMVEPLHRAVLKIRRGKDTPVYIMSAKGRLFNQEMAEKIRDEREVILLCPRYEGYDQRIVELVKAEEISIGNYILMGGDIPAMAVIEASARLVGGVLGSPESLESESFSKENILEYPQYTRPPSYLGKDVPKILLSGNHKQVREYRIKEGRKTSLGNRPDLNGA